MASTDKENNSRKKALTEAVSQIEKKFGKGSIMKLGERVAMPGLGVISTGSISIDSALGIGGAPRGRVIEIFGPESSGKTTLAIHLVASAQAMGGSAAFVDAEHAFDPTYAAALGVDIDDMLISQPDSGEQALEITETLARSGAIDIIVIDSVAALTPRSELQGEMGDPQMGMQARLMSQALRKLTAVVARSGACLVFINQIRHKIGGYGNPETTTGGNALKFYASIRIDIRKVGQLKDQGDLVGHRTKVKVVKNKMAPPFKEVELDVVFGEGFSRTAELVDLGVEHEVVKKSGAWYSFGDERIGQGKENVKRHFKENPDLAAHVEKLIREKIGIAPVASGSQPEARVDGADDE